MRNIFRIIEQAPIISLHKMNQGVYTLATYLNGPKANQQLISDLDNEDKEDIDLQSTKSALSVEPSCFQSKINAYEFNRTDFDFIKSEHAHICTFSDAEFKEGVVDLVNMTECVSVIIDDDEMLFGEDF